MPEAIPHHRIMDAADRAEARAERKAAPRPSRGRLSSMDLVPEDAQEDILWAVGELNKRERQAEDIRLELNDRLAAKDVDPISKSAFGRKSVRLAAMSARLNEARHIFQGLAPQFTADKVDEHTVALGEFIKLLVFELVQEEGGAVGPKGAMELARAYLAAIQGQKLSADRRQKIEAEMKGRLMKAAESAVGEVAEAGKAIDGAAVLKRIRQDVYGIVDP